MSERTFKKDIELINTVSDIIKLILNENLNNYFFAIKWFRDDVGKDEKRPAELSLLFSAAEPLLESHQKFLHQIEQTLSAW